MEKEIIQFLNKTFTLVAVLVVGVLVFFVGEMIFQNKTIDQQNQNQITVSGQGTIYAKPDVAIISLGVTAQASTVAGVTTAATKSMNAVIDAVKKLGVAEKDIQTTNYSLTPVYENYTVPAPVPLPIMYPSTSSGVVSSGAIIRSGSTLIGYKLEQDVQVKIRDFTKIGDVLSGATTAGANLVGDLQFTIDNPAQFKEQARAKAIAQAKADAQNLAKESGISLGKIINVYEGGYYMPAVYNSAKSLSVGATESAPTPTIQPGQQEIDITINLTYRVN